MHGSRIGVLLVAAAALAACSSNQRYSVSHATPASTTYPATTYYAPATSYTPAPVAAPGATSVTFDLSRTDRQSTEAAALRYCGDQGRSAAFHGIDGYAITYDCIPTPGYGTVLAPASAVPSVTYQDIGTDPMTLQADASRFCARQGLGAVYRGRDGDRVVYDCVGNVAMIPSTASSATMSGSSMPAPTPRAIPMITYETAGDLRSAAETPAIKYCGQLGLTPVLRDQVGRRVTYECH